MDYHSRERLKFISVAGRESITADEFGKVLTFLAHFDRAIEGLEIEKKLKRKLKIPIGKEIKTYAGHYVWANKERLGEQSSNLICTMFKVTPNESPYLPKGASIYRST
jgi:hypothetical protein